MEGLPTSAEGRPTPEPAAVQLTPARMPRLRRPRLPGNGTRRSRCLRLRRRRSSARTSSCRIAPRGQRRPRVHPAPRLHHRPTDRRPRCRVPPRIPPRLSTCRSRLFRPGRCTHRPRRRRRLEPKGPLRFRRGHPGGQGRRLPRRPRQSRSSPRRPRRGQPPHSLPGASARSNRTNRSMSRERSPIAPAPEW